MTMTLKQERCAQSWSVGWLDGAAGRVSCEWLLPKNFFAAHYRAGRLVGVEARAQAAEQADGYALKERSADTNTKRQVRP